MPFSYLLIAGGLVFVTKAIRGTKPASTVLWGNDESGKPIKTRERISWAILGSGLILLGVLQIMSRSK